MVANTRFAFGLIFVFVFLIGFGSAGISINSIPTGLTGIHGQTISGIISLSYRNITQNLTNVVLSGAHLSFSPNNFSFSNGEDRNISVIATIPLYTVPGARLYSFLVNGTNGSHTTTASSSFTINVNTTKSLLVETKTITDQSNTTTIRITNNGNVLLSGNLVFPSNKDGITINSSDASFNLAPNSHRDITLNLGIPSSTRVGTVAIDLRAVSNQDYNSSISHLYIERTYCRYGEKGDLIRIIDIEDRTTGDEWEWEPLEIARIRVEVENRDSSRRTVTLNLALYDSEGRSVWLSTERRELEETLRIAAEDDARHEFEFTIPANLDRDERYRLYVKAYSRESEQCTSRVGANFFIEVDVDTDKKTVMDELDMPQLWICGATNSVSLRLHNLNLGDEEKMRLNLFNNELGLNIFSDHLNIDEGESERLSLNFLVPEGKEAKVYRVTFYAEYDYRESLDTFRGSENLGTYSIRVEGDRCNSTSRALISAELSSGTKTRIGKDLIVNITIQNPANLSNFVLSLEGYESWASSAKLDINNFNLERNGSRTVRAIIRPTKSGTQEFTVRAIAGGGVVEQKIAVSIEEKSGWLSKLADSIREESAFWLTIAIFIVLVLIILVLLIKFVNSKKE